MRFHSATSTLDPKSKVTMTLVGEIFVSVAGDTVTTVMAGVSEQYIEGLRKKVA